MKREDIDASITEILVDRHGVKNSALRLQLVRLFEGIKRKIERLGRSL